MEATEAESRRLMKTRLLSILRLMDLSGWLLARLSTSRCARAFHFCSPHSASIFRLRPAIAMGSAATSPAVKQVFGAAWVVVESSGPVCVGSCETGERRGPVRRAGRVTIMAAPEPGRTDW